MKIVGENPKEYQTGIKTIFKIPIKNPYSRIKTIDITSNLIDTKEFKTQIEELLQNNLIRQCFNSHKSLVFLVKNYNEEKQVKTKVIINYKILNNDDAYKIPNKDSSINFIQGCKYFFSQIVKVDFGKLNQIKKANHKQYFHVLVDYMNRM